ncbi:MAG: hypothetical protein KDD35_06420, partial [Bdellovibrionales bacterium]|nr:hypothetical protein [Bdellovibrionales bacterium]
MKEINFSFSLVEHIQSFQKKVVALVQSRQMKQAEEVIRSFNPENLLGNRIKEHCRGIYFEYMGDLEMAYSTYLRAIEKYGENVNLYRDLASACYQLDLTAKWRFYHQTLKRRLNEFDEEIGIESKTSCFLLLGKFCEEDGDLRGALNLYEECFESLGSIEDPESRKLLYLKILPQIVRIRAQFNHIDNMGSFYSELISINRVDIPKHLDVEVQHSLMLAEVNLIGPHHAWVRAKLILDDPNVLES